MRTRTTLVAAALAVLTCASGASATTITITGNGDYRAGAGGEFNVRAADAGGAAVLAALSSGYTTVNGTVVGTANGTRMNAGFGGQIGFQTFCIEYNENIALPGTYDVAISDGAVYGGVAGGIDPDGGGPLPTTDKISVGAAYLYSQFATGNLAGYTYTNGAGRAASAVKLQEAIWYLEDEISLTAGQIAANSFLQAAITTHGVIGAGVGNAAGGAKADNAIYSVKALNLGGTAPNQKQDQLVMVPDAGLTATLLGLGMGGLAVLRRRLS